MDGEGEKAVSFHLVEASGSWMFWLFLSLAIGALGRRGRFFFLLFTGMFPRCVADQDQGKRHPQLLSVCVHT